MKKAKSSGTKELRSEYRRSDFGPLVRGKYAARLEKASNIVILEPEIAKAFPNDRAVNDTLRSVLELAKSTRIGQRKSARAAGLQR